MNTHTHYSLVASQDGLTARLAWISPSTGIAYCGVCMGAQIRPEVGELCSNCGGCVVSVFDSAASAESIRNAWRSALPAPQLRRSA